MRDAVGDYVVGRDLAERFAFHAHFARGSVDQTRDDAQQRGLARAVRTDHRNRLAGLHVEAHVEQRLEAAVAGGYVLQREHLDEANA